MPASWLGADNKVRRIQPTNQIHGHIHAERWTLASCFVVGSRDQVADTTTAPARADCCGLFPRESPRLRNRVLRRERNASRLLHSSRLFETFGAARFTIEKSHAIQDLSFRLQ
jgi:hypothetical protein